MKHKGFSAITLAALLVLPPSLMVLSSPANAGSCVATRHTVRCCVGPFCGQIECSLCHYERPGEEEKEFLEKYTDKEKAVHEKEIYPKYQYHLKEAQRLDWGAGYLLLEEDELVLLDQQGQKELVFPSGAMILKNCAGEPALLYIP